MTTLLTIEREYASGASAIAERVARALDWKLWDQRLTEEVARRLECDRRHVEHQEERKDSLSYKLFKSFLRGSYEGSLNASRLRLADAEGIREASEALIRDIAEKGRSVIVGRGSAYYLCNRPDAFHVFIYAPFAEKVNRLKSEGKSEGEATDLVQHVDQDRTAFIKEHFGIEWPARHYFHLMVNSTIGEEAAAEMIIHGLTTIRGVQVCPPANP